jgi:FAD/FMN-containing dehydrogenase
MTALDSLDELTAQVRGPVLRPGQDGFAEEVSACNVAVAHNPEVAVGATCAEDVAAALRWASAQRMPVAVQATGHGAERPIDHGLLLNTSRMQDLVIDAEARTATIGAGVKWKTLLERAAEHGLAGLCGSASDVGIVGYTLGGGLPVLGRAFGFAAEQVRSAQVVTCDGVVRQVDPDTEPELFWALRGGKGNVGVVTSLTFGLLPISRIYGGGIFFRGEDAPALLRAYADWVPGLPDQMCTSIALLRLPPFPELPEPLRGRFVTHLRIAYPGASDEGERLLAPMRQTAEALIDGVGEMSYSALDAVYQDPDHPVPFEEAGCLLAGFGPDAVDALLRAAGPEADCPLLLVEIRHLGGALARGPQLEDAVCAREAAFALHGVGVLAGPHAGQVPAGLAALHAAMAPYATGGTMVNFHGAPGDAADRARAWTPEVHERLRRAKGVNDPDNLLRFGHALEPLPA